MTPEQYQQRNQHILTERRAGKTLKAIGDSVGRSPERIRQILITQERREQYQKFLLESGLDGLSRRSIAVVKNELGRDHFTWRDWREIATIADDEFLYGRNNKYLCGRKHLREIRKWQIECKDRSEADTV